jgi:predicted component of type VI protein secretion system
MVQLHVLNGASAGARVAPEKFPITVGRAPANSLALSDPGVFDTHFEIQFTPGGFCLAHTANAPIAINGQSVESGVILRNGDIIGAGYANVQFWLGAMPQRELKAREIAAWMLILVVAAVQLYCLARLLAMARL